MSRVVSNCTTCNFKHFTQLFFIDKTGNDCFTSKADIWSALLTLIYVLLGKTERVLPLEKVCIIKGNYQVAVNLINLFLLKAH